MRKESKREREAGDFLDMIKRTKNRKKRIEIIEAMQKNF